MLDDPVHAHDNDTTRRLIAAAAEQFARHGFAAARVRQIVDAAQVNLAAVNYYFGGKEGLYRATLRHLASSAGAPNVRALRGHAPEERLQRHIYALLERYLGHGRPSALGRILAHESMNPTAHVEALVEDMLRPELEELRALVREIAGPGVDLHAATRASLAVMGHCLLYVFARHALERVDPDLLRGRDACKALAREVTQFALRGIAGLRAKDSA